MSCRKARSPSVTPSGSCASRSAESARSAIQHSGVPWAPMTLAPLLALVSLAAIQQPATPVETAIERLAPCQDSWREWKDDPAQSKKVGELFTSSFEQLGKD